MKTFPYNLGGWEMDLYSFHRPAPLHNPAARNVFPQPIRMWVIKK